MEPTAVTESPRVDVVAELILKAGGPRNRDWIRRRCGRSARIDATGAGFARRARGLGNPGCTCDACGATSTGGRQGAGSASEARAGDIRRARGAQGPTWAEVFGRALADDQLRLA